MPFQLSLWKDTLHQHVELILAILSGFLLIGAFILEQNQLESAAVTLFLLAYVIGGFFKAKEGIEDSIETKSFNVELLMVLAAVGAGIIGYWFEGAMLIFIFALSGALETYTLQKSTKELSSLLSMQPSEAIVVKGEHHELVPIELIAVGEQIFVKPGEKIALDGRVVNGTSTVDQAAITGESLLVTKSIGEQVYAGSINMSGAITVEVTAGHEHTLASQMITLVQEAQKAKAPSQLFLEKFEKVYVQIVLWAVTVMIFLPVLLFDWSLTESFYRAMILLVVASPCALVASITPATLAAISKSAREGVLVKGGDHFEHLAFAKVMAFDKTGTLTKGELRVTDYQSPAGMEDNDFLRLLGSMEKSSAHPLAAAITSFMEKERGLILRTVDTTEYPGEGISASVNHVSWNVGNASFTGATVTPTIQEFMDNGKTVVFAKSDQGQEGYLVLQDTIRPEASSFITSLKEDGIYTVMITGDTHHTSASVAKLCNVDEFHAACLPVKKVKILERLRSTYTHTVMVGDGMNDGPALATAKVGIAMGTGTDLAIETADIILTRNSLKAIGSTLKTAKKLKKIILQNIVFSISVIFLLILSNYLQIIDIPLGVIGHEGSTILVILNSLRMLK
ncbi:heavy metal translocating P-type ATPase [Mangrovibacillus cuniculi]|uniref:Cadmium-translocating P-type ATPase n=1 Tax=Mangrovibacillus cuniculi TaxID=2593652 RepID=A0A7S8HEP9_9BACI|nr:heavy metal translocating P-type ATPase [Mangrovibacillus cuniculi]QPC45620.1 cadmium-translocating P-type ATPase [Mangrovibacillus cuniculi]